jgi:hypothetical protein
MSNLESKEDASAGAKDGDNGSGRILAVFDASKVNKEENNSTTEMRLRAFLMFEWKKCEFLCANLTMRLRNEKEYLLSRYRQTCGGPDE